MDKAFKFLAVCVGLFFLIKVIVLIIAMLLSGYMLLNDPTF